MKWRIFIASNAQNFQKITNQLHKPKRIEIEYSSFKDKIWAAYLANM